MCLSCRRLSCWRDAAQRLRSAKQVRRPPGTTRPSSLQTVTPGLACRRAHRRRCCPEGRVAQVQNQPGLSQPVRGTVAGRLHLPTTQGAAVSDFQMTVNGEEDAGGKLLDRDGAAYLSRSYTQRDPALLEYLDHDLFKPSVFPIPPGDAARSPPQPGCWRRRIYYRFSYPLSTERFSAPRQWRKWPSPMELLDQPGLRLFTANYPITIERTAEDNATAVYTAERRPADHATSTSGGRGGQNHRARFTLVQTGGRRWFLRCCWRRRAWRRRMEMARYRRGARRVGLHAQAEDGTGGGRRALHRRRISNAEDRFNLITFSTGVSLWEQRLQPTDGDAMRRRSTGWRTQRRPARRTSTVRCWSAGTTIPATTMARRPTCSS